MKHLILILLLLPIVALGQGTFDTVIFYQASANLESHLVDDLKVVNGTIDFVKADVNDATFTFKHATSEFDVRISTMEEVDNGTIFYPTDLSCKIFVWDNLNTSFYYNYDEESDMYLESMLFLSIKK